MIEIRRYKKGLAVHGTTSATELYYVLGLTAPHYLVPVIRQHYEFGWSLSDNQPVLIHCIQGVYDD